MDEAAMIQRLAALEAPEVEASRARAVVTVPARIAAGRQTQRRWRPALRLVLAAALVLSLLAAASVFTAPGRSAASWVGERLGFGEPGGPPSLRQLRHAWGKGTIAAGRPAAVLLVGPVPGHGRYEFITYEPRPRPGKHPPPEGPCFELDLTQMRGMSGQGCGVLPAGKDLYFIGPGGNADPDEEVSYLAGRASSEVASVEASFAGRRLAVELVPIPEDFVSRFDLGRTFKFFIAFFDGARHGGPATVTARDAAGRVLGHVVSEVPNTIPMYRMTCEGLQKQRHPNPAALGDCRQVLGPGPW